MSTSPTTTGDCIFELAHDRETEASYFLYRMRQDYHDPMPFRFNLNGFLNALYSLGDMVRLDLERHGFTAWWLDNKQDLYDDPVLSKFRDGRNYTVHRGQLLRGSHLELGLFRGYKLKLAHMMKVDHERSSEDLLRNILQPHWIGIMLDEEHGAIGEQLGVRRTYRVEDLSDEHDVFTACHLALVKAAAFLDRAHEAFGVTSESVSEEHVLEQRLVEDFNLLLEGDLDPTSYVRWGWVDEEQVPD